MAGIRPPDGPSPYRSVRATSGDSKSKPPSVLDASLRALTSTGRWEAVSRPLVDSDLSPGGRESPLETKTASAAARALSSSGPSPASGGAGRASPGFSPESAAKTPPPGGLSLVKVSEHLEVYGALVEFIKADESAAKSILNNPEAQNSFRQDITPFLSGPSRDFCDRTPSFKGLIQYLDGSPGILDKVEPLELKKVFLDFLRAAADHVALIKS